MFHILLPILGAAAVGAGIQLVANAAESKASVAGFDDVGAARGGRGGGGARRKLFLSKHPKAAAKLASKRKASSGKKRAGRGGDREEPLADFDGTSIMDPEWFMEEADDDSGSIFAASDWGLRQGVTVSGVGAEVAVMPNLRQFARGGVARRAIRGITPFGQVPPGFGR